MFFEQLNAAGGINGKQVKLLEYDDKADGTESINAYNLAKANGATAIIGSVLSGASIALSDVTYDDNMPQISASATNPKLTVMDPDDPKSEVKTNVFRSCFLDPFQGEKMAQYAKSKYGAKTIAIFYENGSDYSEAIVQGVESQLASTGLKVVAKEAFATGDVDYKAQMTNIAAANPDVVLMPIYYGEAGRAITALRAAGCKAKIIGGDGFGSVKNYASAADLEGTIYMSGYAPGTPSVAKFEADYQAKYNEEVPNMFAPLAWDASLIMAEALKTAESKGLKAGTAEYKQAVIDAIKGMNAFPGITGSYTFNATNDPIKSVAIIKISNGAELFDEFF
jgi:branched-chain amino acid transport system substrate-binding protein